MIKSCIMVLIYSFLAPGSREISLSFIPFSLSQFLPAVDELTELVEAGVEPLPRHAAALLHVP